MGFWQGLNEGLTYNMEKKAREKEIADARQERLDDRTASLALEEARYNRDKADREAASQAVRKDRLSEIVFSASVAKAEREAAAKILSDEALNFYARFPNSKNPKLDLLKADPVQAAKLEEELRKAEIEAQRNGVPMPKGEELWEYLAVDSVGKVTNLLPEAVINFYPQTYEETAAQVAALQPQTGLRVISSVNPVIYSKPNSEYMTKATAAFDRAIMSAANAELLAMDDTDAAGKSKLMGLIEGYKDPNSQQRFTLLERYGQPIFNKLASGNDAYGQALLEDPTWREFSTKRQGDIELATAILNDPASSANDIAGANQLLQQAYGGTYGG